MIAPEGFRPLICREEIDAAVQKLADPLSFDMQKGDWHVVSILLGAMPFTQAMIMALSARGHHPILDALWLSSYGDAEGSSGHVRIRADISRSIAGKSVLLLDDIYDSGDTLAFAKAHCLAKGAELVKSCALLRKPLADQHAIDYYGLDAPDAFLVGFGLDAAGRYRGLDEIGVIEPNPTKNDN